MTTTAKILFFDESTFKSDDFVNIWNCRSKWTQENPHWFREIVHQHVWKVNVCCEIIGKYVIRPFFFQENLNDIRYANFIQNEIRPCLKIFLYNYA